MTREKVHVAVQTHVITGQKAEVSAVLRRARLDGRLVEVTDAHVLGDGRVRVMTRLRSPRSARGRWQRVRPWLLGTLKITAVVLALAALAGLVWAVGLAVLAVVAAVTGAIAWLHAHLLEIGVVAAIAAVGVFSVFSGSTDQCTGSHCRGCRR